MNHRIVSGAVAVLLVGCGDDAVTPRDGALADATPTAHVSLRIEGGAGHIYSNVPGFECFPDCEADLPIGTSLTLTALALGDATFAGWSHDGCPGTGACTLTVTTDVAVTAMMVPNQTLVIVKTGDGAGTVMSSPIGIDCGSDCSEQFAPGTSVTLSATPTGSAVFAGWSGACTGTGSCTVTVDGALGVAATFAIPRYALTVTKEGSGTGSVTGAGIDCGADCSEVVATGTQVELTATADAGSLFSGWSGACSGTGACTVLVESVANVTATFVRGGCDDFERADSTDVAGWTERAGDWEIQQGRLRHTTITGTEFSHVITRDGSELADGCVTFSPAHSGSAGNEQSAAAVLRWSAPDTYLMLGVKENTSGSGAFSAVVFREFPSGTGSGANILTLGPNPLLKVCASGSMVTMYIDHNRDGVIDNDLSFATTVSTPGLTGVMTWSNSATNVATIDDVCWSSAP